MALNLKNKKMTLNLVTEETKRCEEKVKLFNELIQIDGEEWRAMVANLQKKEYEDQQRRFRELEKEELEEWDRFCNQQMKEWKTFILFELLTKIDGKDV